MRFHNGFVWTTFLAVTLLVGLLWVGSFARPVAGHGGATNVKGGYYSSSTLTKVDFTQFTHLFYAFARVDNTSTVLAGPHDAGGLEKFPFFAKESNPSVFTLISISLTNDEFTRVVATDDSRRTFINSSISLARSSGYDGLDMDWEFAQSQNDMDAFALFIQQWRQAVVSESQLSSGAPLLLTAAVYFSSTILFPGKGSYPITAIAENLDFVNIMCYDFHGSWNVNNTGANSNLYAPHSVLSADYGISSWLSAGLPPDKAVLGLTLYGRSWTLKNQTLDAGLNASATAAGPAQPFSQTAGVFYYYEVANWIEANNATVVHDQEEVTAYCYANDIWVSYEDPEIVSAKVLYAMSKGLRGYFFWAVTFDRDAEVSTAASQTLDYDVAVSPAPSPGAATSSASSAVASFSLVFAIAALLITMFLSDLNGFVDIDRAESTSLLGLRQSFKSFK